MHFYGGEHNLPAMYHDTWAQVKRDMKARGEFPPADMSACLFEVDGVGGGSKDSRFPEAGAAVHERLPDSILQEMEEMRRSHLGQGHGGAAAPAMSNAGGTFDQFATSTTSTALDSGVRLPGESDSTAALAADGTYRSSGVGDEPPAAKRSKQEGAPPSAAATACHAQVSESSKTAAEAAPAPSDFITSEGFQFSQHLVHAATLCLGSRDSALRCLVEKEKEAQAAAAAGLLDDQGRVPLEGCSHAKRVIRFSADDYLALAYASEQGNSIVID